MKLGLLFEGWEELGIEDPGVDDTLRVSQRGVVIDVLKKEIDSNLDCVYWITEMTGTTGVDAKGVLRDLRWYPIQVSVIAKEPNQVKTLFDKLNPLVHKYGWEEIRRKPSKELINSFDNNYQYEIKDVLELPSFSNIDSIIVWKIWFWPIGEYGSGGLPSGIGPKFQT